MSSALHIKHCDPARGPRFYAANRQATAIALSASLAGANNRVATKPTFAVADPARPRNYEPFQGTDFGLHDVYKWREGLTPPPATTIAFNPLDALSNVIDTHSFAHKIGQDLPAFDGWETNKPLTTEAKSCSPSPLPAVAQHTNQVSQMVVDVSDSTSITTPITPHVSIVDDADPFIIRGRQGYFEVSSLQAVESLRTGRTFPRVNMAGHLYKVLARARERSPEHSSFCPKDCQCSYATPLPKGRPYPEYPVVGSALHAATGDMLGSSTSVKSSISTDNTATTNSRRTSDTDATSLDHAPTRLFPTDCESTIKPSVPAAEAGYHLPTGLLESPQATHVDVPAIQVNGVRPPKSYHDPDDQLELRRAVHARNAARLLGPPRDAPSQAPAAVTTYFNIAKLYRSVAVTAQQLLASRRQQGSATCFVLDQISNVSYTEHTRMRSRGFSLETMLSHLKPQQDRLGALAAAAECHREARIQADHFMAFIDSQWLDLISSNPKVQLYCYCCNKQSRM